MTRWTRFAGVGVMGFVVQLVMLWVLTHVFEMHYVVAVVLSVEAAILHNFVWHERWTWRDRISDSGPHATLGRLARFNSASGVISLVGNAVFTALFVSVAGLPVIAANVAAILCLTVLNFIAADRFAFCVAGMQPRDVRPRRTLYRRATAVLATVAILAGTTPSLQGAELKPAAIVAWDQYVAGVEARLTGETRHSDPFLTSDFAGPGSSGPMRDRIKRGEIVVENVAGGPVNVGAATISHWRGSVFVPGVTLDQLLDGAALRGRAARHRQEDVLEARVLARDGDSLRLFLKLQRTAIVTVAYNTEHVVSYKRHGSDRATSRSISTRIAELRDAGTPHEGEKPVGQDRGFIWRLHSYWKYQATAGGVIVELESLTLSRDVPWAVRALASPIIERIARESMTRTLTSLRARYSSSSVASLVPVNSGIGDASDSASSPALA